MANQNFGAPSQNWTKTGQDPLDAAIAEEAKLKQAAEQASEGVAKFQKIANGSISKVIVLNQNNYNNHVLGAR